MKIERIVLTSVIARNGKEYPAWIDTTQDCQCVMLDGFMGGKWYIESLVHYIAVNDGDDFIMHDNYDGSQDIYIPLNEIKRLVHQIFTIIPGSIGKLSIKVVFEPCDPSVPF